MINTRANSIPSPEVENPTAPVMEWNDVLGLALIAVGGIMLWPMAYFSGALLIAFSRRWSTAARVLLVGAPFVIAVLAMLSTLLQYREWWLVLWLQNSSIPWGYIPIFTTVQVVVLFVVRYLARN